MPPKGTGAPYKNGSRYWGDFRSFADVGGDREPLVPPGEKLATKDPGLARELYDARRQALKALRDVRSGAVKPQKSMHPAEYAATRFLPFLEQRKRNRRGQRADEPLKKNDVEAIKKTKHALTVCLSQRSISGVTLLPALGTDEMTALITELLNGRDAAGTAPSPQTVRRHLMELSAMFERARFDKYMDSNPLEKHPDIPAQQRGSALDPDGYLVRDEVRRLLDEIVPSSKNPWAVEQAYVLFYTGCRLNELNGILVRDVDFEDQWIHILNYEHRSLKSPFARRQVPLWPKLAAVLQESLRRKPRPANGLLFPRPGITADQALEDQMMTRLRKSLFSAAQRAGITKPIGHHIARHSYISARREMKERDALGREGSVTNAVIVREVGHATDDLIQTTYGHLPRMREQQFILDYYDTPVDFEERVKRGRTLMSEAVKAGLQRSKERKSREASGYDSDVTPTTPGAMRAPRARGRFAKREHAAE